MVLLTDGWSQWAAAAAAADPLIAVAPPAIAPTRLAHIASTLFPDSISTPSQAIRAAKRGRILIDDNTASHAALVHEGSILTLLPASSSVVAAADDETVRFAASCVRAGLRVLYEDDGFAVVYKPAGVHTKPWGGMRAARTHISASRAAYHCAANGCSSGSIASGGKPRTASSTSVKVQRAEPMRIHTYVRTYIHKMV